MFTCGYILINLYTYPSGAFYQQRGNQAITSIFASKALWVNILRESIKKPDDMIIALEYHIITVFHRNIAIWNHAAIVLSKYFSLHRADLSLWTIQFYKAVILTRGDCHCIDTYTLVVAILMYQFLFSVNDYRNTINRNLPWKNRLT